MFPICRYNLMVECFTSPAASYYGPEWQLVVDMFARYLAVLNSSINFIIYFAAGKQFRRVTLTLLHLRADNTIHHLAEASLTLFAVSILPMYFSNRT